VPQPTTSYPQETPNIKEHFTAYTVF
jgi:hypothetical protein